VHDHDLIVGFDLGPDALRVLLMLSLLGLASYALQRPFLPDVGPDAALVLTGVGGSAVLLVLLVADAVAVGGRGAVALLVLQAVPVVTAARRRVRDGITGREPGRRWAVWSDARVAPFVVVAATAATTFGFAAAWSPMATGGAPGSAFYSAVLAGVVGVSWLTMCRPWSRAMRAVVHATGVGLGTAVAAGAAALGTAGPLL
jgi:uncharacterized protein DUF6239